MHTIFLCSCPAHFPFLFAQHSWWVYQEGDIFTRYEILWQKHPKTDSHLHRNTLPPFSGISYFPFGKNIFLSHGKILASIEGDIAKNIGHALRESYDSYAYRNTYKLLGPNSNTYTASILNQFPEFPYRLSSRHIGKDYIAQ